MIHRFLSSKQINLILNCFFLSYLSFGLKRVAVLAPVYHSWTEWILYRQWPQVTSQWRQKVTFYSSLVLFNWRYPTYPARFSVMSSCPSLFLWHASCTQHVDNFAPAPGSSLPEEEEEDRELGKSYVTHHEKFDLNFSSSCLVFVANLLHLNHPCSFMVSDYLSGTFLTSLLL